MDDPDPEQDLPKVLLSPEEDIRVELTNEALSISSSSEWVKSTKAGAVVVFAGTTRDTFNARPVKQLQYTSYTRKAIKTLYAIAHDLKHGESHGPSNSNSNSNNKSNNYDTDLKDDKQEKEKEKEKEIKKISISHRLGVVPIGEESIVIAVSAVHRHAAWRAGEEALERCKAEVEIWKWEEFADGHGGEGGGGEGVWRAN